MKRFSLFFLLCVCFALTMALGQVPRKLSYQGLLTNSSGIPLADGNYDLTFKIYNAPASGTLKYTEAHPTVSVEKGTFSVILGSITPFAFSFTESLYVDITINNGPAGITYPVTFSSRTALTAAPYALGPWSPTDSSVSFSGKVGIGTSSPTQNLEVNGTTKTTSIQITSGATKGYVLKSDSLGNASWVNPSGLSSGSAIADSDGNTKVEAGISGDDKIHFTMGGTEYFTMNKGKISVDNAAGSLYIGSSAGNADPYVSTQFNVGIGANSLQSLTSGAFANSALGHRALQNLTTGAANTALGEDAGRRITTGIYNTVIGEQALQFNVTGQNNVAIGALAGGNNVGSDNVFIGTFAGTFETGSSKLYIANSTVYDPLIYGDFSKKHLTINDSLTSKYFQMKNGATSGYVMQSDSNGNAKWISPTSLSVTGDNLGNHTATQNIKLGEHFLSNEGNDLGIKVNVFGHVDIVGHAPNSILTIGSDTSQADYLNFAVPGQDWQLIGSTNDLSVTYDDDTPFKIKAGSIENTLVINGNKVGIGLAEPTVTLEVVGTVKTDSFQMTTGATNGYILQSNSSGNASWVNPSTFTTASQSSIADSDGNTKVEAGQSVSDDRIHFTLGGSEYFTMSKGVFEMNNGSNSVLIGSSAGNNIDNSSLTYNTAIGSNALQSNVNGSFNVAVGKRALQSNFSSYNIAIGGDAAKSNLSGAYNVAVGHDALYSNTNGERNVAVGFNAGYNTTGSHNVFLGTNAGYSETGSNKLYIANSITPTPLLYGDFDSRHLTINDSLTSKYFQMTNGASNGYVLKSDANGNASWVNPTTLSVTGDNLGNHTATQNVKLNGNWLSNDGGNEGVYVDGSGRVGIGTSSPGALLDVYASGSDTARIKSETDAAYLNMVTPAGKLSGTLFSTNVSGTAKARWIVGKSSASESGSNNGSDYFINRYDDSGAFQSQPFRIARSTGYVGISTATPSSQFEVNGSVGMKVKTALSAGTNNPDETGEFWFYNAGTGTITLPTASTCANRMYVIINQTGASRTISSYKDLSAASQTSIANSSSIWIVSDGTNWLQVK